MQNKIKFFVIFLICFFPLSLAAQQEVGTKGIGFYVGVGIPSHPQNFSNYKGGLNVGISYNFQTLGFLKISPCLSYYNFITTLNDNSPDRGGFLNIFSLSVNMSQKFFTLFKSNQIFIREGVGYYYAKMNDFIFVEDGYEFRYKANGNHSYLCNLGIEVVNNVEQNISINTSFIYNFLGLDKHDRRFITLQLGFNYYFKAN